MRVYLDSCVFQDLKEERYKELLSLIMADKARNIYCFSEAHLYDLSRDKTNYKFSDMGFMEKICENHCFFFNKKTRFEYRTPAQYYDSFDWSYVTTFDDLFSEDGFGNLFQLMLKAIPLDFKDFLSFDQLPGDIPEDFKTLLLKPSNAYEFFQAFMEFTDELTNEQKKFRELIKYLHKNSMTDKIYEGLKIEGYSGGKIIDKEKLRTSYAKYFSKEGQEKSLYDLFIDMYHGLEFFGFVKGKPKKQKMMNLINDARHAFFGAHCDIVVSSDDDFINKTKFMYEMNEIGTLVLHINEMETIINGLGKQSELKAVDLFREVNREDLGNRVIRIEDADDDKAVYFYLERTYFSYFDIYVSVTNKNGTYQYFTKEPHNYSTGTLVKEIEFVTNRLITEFGKDFSGHELFSAAEIVDGKWHGRSWVLGETVIELNYSGKMNLALYPMQYIQSIEKENIEV